jgi:hypothetical protein
MKKIAIIAAVAAMFAGSAMAHDNGPVSSGSVSGGLSVGGEYTIGKVSGSVSATSQTQGNAVSATRVNGNGYSSQQTTSVGSGSATGSINVTPNGVTASTSQTSKSDVVSNGFSSGNTPALDGNGLIVNGAAGLSQTTTAANAGVSQTFTGETGQLAIGGIAGYQATGALAGIGGW